MKKEPHRLTDVDPQRRVGFCSVCGENTRVTKANSKGHWRCVAAKTLSQGPYKRYRKENCERCGLVPEHRSQLHVDHIDENHSNNAPENLQTLCANCHAYKTWCHRHGDKALYSVRYRPRFKPLG